MHRNLVLFALAALMLATASAPAQDGTGSEAGHQTFDHWCAPCHAPGPGHPGTQALDALYQGQKPAALEQRSDLVPELTRAIARSGGLIMPPFRKTEITDDELDALASYLAPQD
jgi:mono/diheme cytochrome c family protein